MEVIIIVILSLLLVIIALLCLGLLKYPPCTKDDAAYYDENGNHIYYDRKLIEQLEREKKQTGQ